jgi:hypothetical protein
MTTFTITAAGKQRVEVRVQSGELITLSLSGNSPESDARGQIYALSMLAGLSDAEREAKMDQAEQLVRSCG